MVSSSRFLAAPQFIFTRFRQRDSVTTLARSASLNSTVHRSSPHIYKPLGVDVDLCPAAPVPGSEEDTAFAAFVLNVLEGGHHVWDTAKAESDECDECPGAAIALVAAFSK